MKMWKYLDSGDGLLEIITKHLSRTPYLERIRFEERKGSSVYTEFVLEIKPDDTFSSEKTGFVQTPVPPEMVGFWSTGEWIRDVSDRDPLISEINALFRVERIEVVSYEYRMV